MNVFGFENWSEKLADVADKLAVLNDMQRKLDKVIVDKGIPYTTILVAYHELEQSITAFRKEVSDIERKTRTKHAVMRNVDKKTNGKTAANLK